MNVVLVPATFAAVAIAESAGLPQENADAYHFLREVRWINGVLLIFNMMPVYPLDGGQILQALLWFVVGRPTSLLVVSIIGMLGAVAIIGLAVLAAIANGFDGGTLWIGLIAFFVASRCWAGFRQARLLAQIENAPRHRDARCPSCDAHPLQGDFWQCNQCGTRFDTFVSHGICPACSERFFKTTCPECLQTHHVDDWFDPSEPEA